MSKRRTSRNDSSTTSSIILLLFVLAGCSSTPPTAFYTLNSLDDPFPQNSEAGTLSDIVIGVGPIVLPEYLDRPQIVTRSTSNRLDVNEFQQWGGSLKEDFSRVLIQNLSLQLASNRVRVYPSPEPIDLDYRVFIDVQQFDGRLGEGVRLNAVWTLMDEHAGEPLAVRRFDQLAPASEPTYEALVAAHSNALLVLSFMIADAIRKLNNP